MPEWPNFSYDPARISSRERQFLIELGSEFAYINSANQKERDKFIVEILSAEGEKSSKIEGEILERESLRSSIKRHFGLRSDIKEGRFKESGMAELLCSVYKTFEEPLTHQMLKDWHAILFRSDSKLADNGKYRSHPETMQIVSHRLDSHEVFFEDPPSDVVETEMTRFIKWFNETQDTQPILGRAAIAHVYFESIHPFEDGNGRIGRMLIKKVLSQGVGKPVLIAVSKTLEKRRKHYYKALGRCNRTLEVNHWVDFFSDAVLQAQKDAMQLCRFLVGKSRMLSSLSGSINPRQEKVLLRMFEVGPEGFKGGLRAENYISITKASRATATRDLNNLVQQGALLKTGTLRHTRYWLNLDS